MIRLPVRMLVAIAALASWTLPPGAQMPDSEDPFDFAADVEPDDNDLKSLSLEELMDIEVTISSRSEERLSSVPGAVYVLTGDEIRAAGHSSIQEALRMVPGFYVSHWEPSSWDVTSRGFGPGLSLTSLAYLNQLLVMIDGVSVYTPLFAGVWWALVDVDLADIDRVEIIRGPGGILWGSNAVHGVVNIITKKASETQGPQLSVHHGIDDRHVGVRYGGTFGETGAYRVWTKGAFYDDGANPFLGFEQDWHTLSAGFRTDWSDDDGRRYTFSTRAYESKQDAIGFDLMAFVPIPVEDLKTGFQFLGRVSNPETRSELQAWYSSDRQQMPTLADVKIDQLDLNYQRELRLGERNRLTLGAGWRSIWSDLFGPDTFFLDFQPRELRLDVFRAYAIDKIAITEATEVTLGTTLEHNDFTQFEVQPTARVAWRADEDLTLWAAISRAVRTPSLEERTLTMDSAFVGSDSFRSETLIAYETGARARVSERVALDLALFYNDYDDLHFEDFDGFQSFLTNEAEGTSYGAELAVDATPTERWTIRSALSFIQGDYESKVDGSDLGTEDYHPERQFNVRSYYELGHGWEFDAAFYVVDKLGPGFEIAEYVRTDLRLAWEPCEELELFVGVQHLNNSTHSELDEFDNIRRSFIMGLVWNP